VSPPLLTIGDELVVLRDVLRHVARHLGKRTPRSLRPVPLATDEAQAVVLADDGPPNGRAHSPAGELDYAPLAIRPTLLDGHFLRQAIDSCVNMPGAARLRLVAGAVAKVGDQLSHATKEAPSVFLHPRLIGHVLPVGEGQQFVEAHHLDEPPALRFGPACIAQPGSLPTLFGVALQLGSF